MAIGPRNRINVTANLEKLARLGEARADLIPELLKADPPEIGEGNRALDLLDRATEDDA